MSRKIQFTALAPLLAMILAIAVGTPARAQMLVFDPSNYSQNLLTAARSLQQIQNQIKSLQNEAQMLINQAKQLELLPTTVLNDVERDYSQVQTLLKQANGITYNVQSLNQAYSQRYPVSISSSTSDLQIIASAEQRWQDSLSAFQHSLTLGAGAVQNLPNTQAQTASLLTILSGKGCRQAVSRKLIALDDRLFQPWQSFFDVAALQVKLPKATHRVSEAGTGSAFESLLGLFEIIVKAVPAIRQD
jgi:P-type conjugative transfer protein TrbJ